MTTKTAARLYEAMHLYAMEGKRTVIYNPHSKPIDELPVIYGFNNGGIPGWLSAIAIAEDGTELGGHICSSEAYMPHDLGILEGTRPDRHEKDYSKHYPDGYRMEFVSYDGVKTHEKLNKAFELHRMRQQRDKK